MGIIGGLPADAPCAKGWIPYGLDEISRGRGARARLRRLSEAIRSLAPNYQNLERVFDTHILSHVMTDPRAREEFVAYLSRHWFDATSSETYFPGQNVAQIYAEGVLKALELSLKGRRTAVPIDAWWVVDSQEIKILTFADIDEQGMTVGGRLTLLILTPRPRADVQSRGTFILGRTAQAWASGQRGNRVATSSVKDLR